MANYFYNKYNANPVYSSTSGHYSDVDKSGQSGTYSIYSAGTTTYPYRLSGYSIIVSAMWDVRLRGQYCVDWGTSQDPLDGLSYYYYITDINGYRVSYDYHGVTVSGYTPGSLVQPNIIAPDGTYPVNGRHTDGYWYVRGAQAFPSFKMKVDSNLKTSQDGWVKINGVLRHIEGMWININGVLKKL